MFSVVNVVSPLLQRRRSSIILDAFSSRAQRFFCRCSSGVSTNSSEESFVTTGSSTSETPLFDVVDSLINGRLWFSSSDFCGYSFWGDGLSFSFVTQRCAAFLVLMQENLGMEPSSILLIFGILVRLCTFIFSFYGDRATARLVAALPELKAAHDTHSKKHAEGAALKRYSLLVASNIERKAILKKHRTSPVSCIAYFAAMPLVGLGFAISSVFSSMDHSSASPFAWWFPSLSQSDPTFLLPFFCSMLSLLNFELLMSPSLRKEYWVPTVLWGARVSALLLTPVIASFHAGVCIFWLGMNAVGIFHPLLLKNTTFRRICGFPHISSSI